MIDETPLLTHERLSISDRNLIIDGASYEIGNITSLKSKQLHPGRSLAYACMAAGVGLMLCNDVLAGIGYTFMFLGAALWSIAQPKYLLIIEISNEETLTFTSPIKKEIRMIADALNTAINIRDKSQKQDTKELQLPNP